jgi:saccharopine dehydrogenase-like NADP-dependent oxidoreductase
MSENLKTVLVLGAGMVARPLVRYLMGRPGTRVTVASRTVSRAEALVHGDATAPAGAGHAVAADVDDAATLERLVATHDIAVSLLPAPRHPEVARLCLKHRKHMATTSYISPAMRAMHDEASGLGLTFLNECGVDPGIDHMSAMRIFDATWKRGGEVVSFRSYCGGLPAPEANTNPVGYKFSWAPRGVLTAARNSASYLENGVKVEVPGPELFSDCHMLTVPGAGTFEAYPNRDSLSYMETYGLSKVHTMYRGTLRNPGHCRRWKAWVDLGLFDITPRVFEERTYAGVLRSILGLAPGAVVRPAVASRLGLAPDDDPVEVLGWLGLFGDEPLSASIDNPLDTLAAAMLQKLQYEPGERDMLVMHHEVVSSFPGRPAEKTFMDLVDFGVPGGDSSMARTVSLPCAIGVRLILDGRIPEIAGVWAPVVPALYGPILDELAALGIVCGERTELLG